MNNEKNNGKGIFYGVIGVATLIVAIIGATFAYFTATVSAGANDITGNAATVSFGLEVEKVTHGDEKDGMIPMTNSMAEKAVTNASSKGACIDDTGAAVCQIYKITVTNTGSAALFLDGYVNLTGGDSAPSQVNSPTATETNMRWAQVFTTDDGTTYTLNGTPVLATGATGIAAIAAPTMTGTSNVDLETTGSIASYTFEGNNYDYINKNWMRTSGKDISTVSSDNPNPVKYSRSDRDTNGLVFNQRVDRGGSVNLYFVVWLSETGENQTMEAENALQFFKGLVTFNSASGGEVSATFNGMTRNPAKTS